MNAMRLQRKQVQAHGPCFSPRRRLPPCRAIVFSPRPAWAAELSGRAPSSSLRSLKTDARGLGTAGSLQIDDMAFTPDVATTVSERLFSNLNPITMKHDPSALLSSVLLIAGTTVGAGMLALPALTYESGFLASSAGLIGSCVYAITTGLLVAEVNINMMRQRGGGGVSMVTMARGSLGSTGSSVVSATYLFLHYSLLVAYISRGGEVINGSTHLPLVVSCAAFAFGSGGLCYVMSPKQINEVNGNLVLLFFATFLALLGLVAPGVDVNNLIHAEWSEVIPTVPVMVLAFVYQNVVPIVVQDLECDPKRVRLAILGGATIPLFMFLFWEGAMLGCMPPGGSGAMVDPLMALKAANPQFIGPLISAFSFLAVLTSYIGFVLSLTDFLADLFHVKSGPRQPPIYLLTIVPALAFAVAYPDVFISALSIAATYGVMSLFGVLPACMSWLQRYSTQPVTLGTDTDDCDVSKKRCVLYTSVELVPGGKPVLGIVGGLAAVIIGNKALEQLGVLGQ